MENRLVKFTDKIGNEQTGVIKDTILSRRSLTAGDPVETAYIVAVKIELAEGVIAQTFNDTIEKVFPEQILELGPTIKENSAVERIAMSVVVEALNSFIAKMQEVQQ